MRNELIKTLSHKVSVMKKKHRISKKKKLLLFGNGSIFGVKVESGGYNLAGGAWW